MTNSTWIETVLRFARHRAGRMLETRPRHSLASDYDIPAFIRRGIRIPALEAFHREGAAPPAPTTAASASDVAGDAGLPHRAACRCPS
jgi:hypothetical protein